MLPGKTAALGTALADWEKLWVEYPKEWKALVKLYLAKVAKEKPIAKASEQQEAEQWYCQRCDASFPTQIGLKLHERRMHGDGCLAKNFVISGWCPSCGKDFHSRLRAINHLQRGSQKCVAAIRNGEVQPCSPEEVAVADEADRQEARRLGLDPYAGPPVVPCTEEENPKRCMRVTR